MSQVLGMMRIVTLGLGARKTMASERIAMTDGRDEPPTSVTYDLDEALELMAALEEARDTLRDTEHFAGVLTLEAQIQVLSRRLGFDDGGTDAR
jgi:hypothetical protein